MNTQQTNQTINKPKKSRKGLWAALGVAGATALGFLGWQYLKQKPKSMDDEVDDTPVTHTSSQVPSSSYRPVYKPTPEVNDDFPLKKGSKGAKVKALQEYLIKRYGKSILPKYGADGDFGSEMVAALEKANLPSEINSTTFNVLTKGSAPDAEETAKALIEAAESKNATKALAELRKIRNTSDYTKVNDEFKEMRIDGGVRKTLVTGMLSTFKLPVNVEKIKLEFLRMGLKYNSKEDSWSLSGIPLRLIVTTQPTEVIDFKHNVKVMVPKNMVLGYFLQAKQGQTLFRSLEANKKLVVKSNAIKFYEGN